jgi:hypothetical protein
VPCAYAAGARAQKAMHAKIAARAPNEMKRMKVS